MALVAALEGARNQFWPLRLRLALAGKLDRMKVVCRSEFDAGEIAEREEEEKKKPNRSAQHQKFKFFSLARPYN